LTVDIFTVEARLSCLSSVRSEATAILARLAFVLAVPHTLGMIRMHRACPNVATWVMSAHHSLH
jgi:hypothetical protein